MKSREPESARSTSSKGSTPPPVEDDVELSARDRAVSETVMYRYVGFAWLIDLLRNGGPATWSVLIGFIALPWLLFFGAPFNEHGWYSFVTAPVTLPLIGRVGGGSLLELFVLGGGVLAGVVTVALLIWVFDRQQPISFLAALCAFGITQVVVLFSALYIQAAHDYPRGSNRCFALTTSGVTGALQPARMHQWDALYFTIGTLTTAGTGALQPASQFCRRLVTLQMIVDFVILAVVVTVVVARLAARLVEANVGPQR